GRHEEPCQGRPASRAGALPVRVRQTRTAPILRTRGVFWRRWARRWLSRATLPKYARASEEQQLVRLGSRSDAAEPPRGTRPPARGPGRRQGGGLPGKAAASEEKGSAAVRPRLVWTCPHPTRGFASAVWCWERL